jgi:UDP-N-acetyl-D-glucosamine dehydrogenase
MRTLNYKTRFIDLASEINSQMPAFVVEKVAHALNAQRKPVNGSRILVLGVAYKRDIDDVRESPALDVIRLLEEQGAAVSFHDPFISMVKEDDHTLHGVELSAAVLKEADAVVIVTDHRSVDYQFVMDNAALIVDSRNVMSGLIQTKALVVTLAASRPADALASGPRLS